MPLKDGYSKPTISHNIRAELAAGRERDQALAIALSKAREASKRRAMWAGGPVEQDSDVEEATTEREDTSGSPDANRTEDELAMKVLRGEGGDAAPNHANYAYQFTTPHPAERARDPLEEEFSMGGEVSDPPTNDLSEMVRRLRKRKRYGG